MSHIRVQISMRLGMKVPMSTSVNVYVCVVMGLVHRKPEWKCPVSRKKDGRAMSFTRESKRVRSQRRGAVLTRQVLCGTAVLEGGGLARAWDSSAEGILGMESSRAELESLGRDSLPAARAAGS